MYVPPWEIAIANPLAYSQAFLLLSCVSVLLCIITLRKTRKGSFEVPGICFFIGYLLPFYYATEAALIIGNTLGGERRFISDADRWSQAALYYESLQAIPLIVMFLTSMVMRSKQVQTYLTRKDSSKVNEEIDIRRERVSRDEDDPTGLDKLKRDCIVWCFFIIIVGIHMNVIVSKFPLTTTSSKRVPAVIP